MRLHNRALPQVYPDQYKEWIGHPVTLHLIHDLERTFLDCTSDPLPTDSLEKLAMEAIKRDSWRELIDLILEWHPLGMTMEGDEDAEP